MDFAEYPVTFILIAANILFSIAGFNSPALLSKTLFYPYGIKRNNEYHRFITSGFLHADWLHLFFNMFTLFFFGRNMEIILSRSIPGGEVWYVVIYFVALIISDVPSYIKHKDNPSYRSLGASGAVSAIVFAAVIFDPWSQIQLYGFISMSALVFAVLYVLYCIYMGKRNSDNVNHDAHLWGSVFGLVATLILITILRPDVMPYILDDLKHPSVFGRREIGKTLQHLLFPGQL